MEPVKMFIVAKVGGFVLSKLLESLYDRLAPLKFWDLRRGEGEGLEANLDKWRQNLQDIQKMLDDAEEKQYSDPAVKQWLDDLKHLVCDVDDIVDELATEASTATENQARPSKVRKLNIQGASSTPQIDSTLQSKIKEVTHRFNEIVTRKDQLNSKETANGRSHGKTEVRAPNSVLFDLHVYGRDKDKMAIVELLVGEKYCSDAQVSVIPILGMGGTGKTTLAQLVYNDEVVQNSFALKAWAFTSEDFDVDRVTKTILQSLTSDNCDGKDRNWLQVKLREKLQGKKFLVVLDDLWNEDYDNWIILRAPFLVGAPGSKIIITTRNSKVSSMTGTIQAHSLPLLSNDDCLSIFTQHALGVSNFSAHSNLQDIGEKFVKRYRGLPLAATILGGLLRTKKEERNEWEDVLKSNIWDMPEARTGILPALMLSYHHLPSHLKRCFSYCSILPEDYEFEEQHLVMLWMAEGLIPPPEGDKKMEDLGREYFQDLVSRSFFQQSSMKKFRYENPCWYSSDHSSKEKPRFVMHDLINNLAQNVAGDICLKMEDEIWRGNERRFPKKEKAERMSALRLKNIIPHSTGSKSFAKVSHEMEISEGITPTRAQNYIKTHTRKDGTYKRMRELMPTDIASSSSVTQGMIRWAPDDAYAKAMKNKLEYAGQVREVGLGIPPVRGTMHSYYRPSESRSQNPGNAEVQQMIEKALEAEREQHRAQMAALRAEYEARFRMLESLVQASFGLTQLHPMSNTVCSGCVRVRSLVESRPEEVTLEAEDEDHIVTEPVIQASKLSC